MINLPRNRKKKTIINIMLNKIGIRMRINEILFKIISLTTNNAYRYRNIIPSQYRNKKKLYLHLQE